MKIPNFLRNKQSVKLENLGAWNKYLAVLHAVQGVAILLLAKSSSWPITTSYLTQDSVASKVAGEPVLTTAIHTLFSVNLSCLVAVYFFISAIAHTVVATKYRKTYETNLKKRINKVRWIDYGLSASTMMVIIAVLSGVYDFSSLLMIFILTLLMNSMGLVMELKNQGAKSIDWLPYWLGCLAGIVPWGVFLVYILGTNIYGSGGIPTFIYFIYGSMFVFFSSFAVNTFLQYRKQGKWADYLFGERAYVILGLISKAALAWQVFFGTLRP